MESELIKFDINHLWHPYSSATKPITPYLVKRAYGAEIELESGEILIEGMSSWWACMHGYNNPRLNAAIERQLKDFSHVMFGGLTHRPAIELGQLLLSIIDKKLEKIFYADSGSVALEVAMKMCVQYFHSRQMPQKHNFISMQRAYHGDTWNAMSVCDPITSMHSIFSKNLPSRFFIPSPCSKFDEQFDENDLLPLKKIIAEHKDTIAAFVIEPIVQGAGGMLFYNAEFINEAYKICKENDILVVFDEVATGFGRTGKLFAYQHTKVVPDIMCIGKALTAGYMTMSAVICSKVIANTISDNAPYAFMHGPTFMANALACSVAKESIQMLLESNWQEQVHNIEQIIKKEFSSLKDLKQVKEIRVLGAIGVIEMEKEIDLEIITKKAVENRIWIRPFGKLIYLMPPFIIKKEQLLKLTKAVVKIIKEI